MIFLRFSIFLFVGACGAAQDSPFKAILNGDIPIKHVITPALDQWLQEPRKSMFVQAAKEAETQWNPNAQGQPQIITIDLDMGDKIAIELGTGKEINPCTYYNFSLWSIPGTTSFYVCSSWIFCRDEKQTKSLYGYPGCRNSILHEDLHLWGMRNHPIPQNGRAVHTSGPIGCGWASDCMDPAITTFTAEDRRAACTDGAWGQPCEGYR